MNTQIHELGRNYFAKMRTSQFKTIFPPSYQASETPMLQLLQVLCCLMYFNIQVMSVTKCCKAFETQILAAFVC